MQDRRNERGREGDPPFQILFKYKQNLLHAIAFYYCLPPPPPIFKPSYGPVYVRSCSVLWVSMFSRCVAP